METLRFEFKTRNDRPDKCLCRNLATYKHFMCSHTTLFMWDLFRLMRSATLSGLLLLVLKAPKLLAAMQLKSHKN